MTLATDRTVPAAVRPRRRRRRILAAVVALLALVVVLVPAGAAASVWWVARQDDRTPSDVVVVLGAAQYWNRPSPVLEARLTQAQALYEEGVAPKIVTVGGNRPGDITTEAQAGRAWLVDRGVPKADVRAIPTGSDTSESLTAVAELMRDRGWSSATIVTDPAHEARSLAIARALGIDARPSPTQSGAGSDVTVDYLARETLGLLQFWLVGRRDVPDVLGS